jgi:hypothetical protein
MHVNATVFRNNIFILHLQMQHAIAFILRTNVANKSKYVNCKKHGFTYCFNSTVKKKILIEIIHWHNFWYGVLFMFIKLFNLSQLKLE